MQCSPAPASKRTRIGIKALPKLSHMNDGGSGRRFTFILLGAQRVRRRRSMQDAKAAKACTDTLLRNFALLRVCRQINAFKSAATFMAITIHAAVSSLITNRVVVAWNTVILCRHVRLACEISGACGNNCVCDVMNDGIL